ncbi:MAG: energy-coupling factor transporter ATPase [Oscillospiraceae bacterium]|nr:energy-coupling factor transporter ATPase [Oscillospiraceae bacterium]
MLEARQITYVYGRGTPFEKTALDGACFSVSAGEFAGIIGHTGSGKSTLIQHLNGLLKPHAGQVLLEGRDIWEKGVKMRDVRFAVGLVFQYPEYQLFEETVEKDVSFGPAAMGLPEADIRERVSEAMAFVGLDKSVAQKSPFDLSGGQKRRAAIAGVIAMRPKVLVLDEPTAGLDPAGRREILGHISEYRRQTGAAVVLVTHSMEDAARVADSLTVLAHAGDVLRGSLKDVFAQRETLTGLGLDVPAVTRVLLRLRALGLDVDAGAYTTEDAIKAIKEVSGSAQSPSLC